MYLDLWSCSWCLQNWGWERESVLVPVGGLEFSEKTMIFPSKHIKISLQSEWIHSEFPEAGVRLPFVCRKHLACCGFCWKKWDPGHWMLSLQVCSLWNWAWPMGIKNKGRPDVRSSRYLTMSQRSKPMDSDLEPIIWTWVVDCCIDLHGFLYSVCSTTSFLWDAENRFSLRIPWKKVQPNSISAT